MAEKLFVFTGESPLECIQKAKLELGEEIELVRTKELRPKSEEQSALYEMIFVLDERESTNSSLIQDALDSRQDSNLRQEIQEDEDKLKIIQDTIEATNSSNSAKLVAKEVMKLKNEKTKDSNQNQKESAQKKQATKLIDESHKSRLKIMQQEQKELAQINDKIAQINDKIKIIQNMFWQEKSEHINIPQEFAEIYRIAKNSGMNKEHIDLIMRLSLELLPVNIRQSSEKIRQYFCEVLKKMILCAEEDIPSIASAQTQNLQDKKIIMLVGPTGVGKTTTIAKLAARYALMLEKRHKVGLITLDTYRLGALDQLMAYAKIMRISIDTVVEPDEFSKALDSLAHCDVILVDTAGRSQNDHEKIEAIKPYIQNSKYKIDVHLVLALNTKYEDLKDAFISFNAATNVDFVIFTKLDESKTCGNMFSLIYEIKRSISYITIGQSVPNDLLKADAKYLANCLMEGFKK